MAAPTRELRKSRDLSRTSFVFHPFSLSLFLPFSLSRAPSFSLVFSRLDTERARACTCVYGHVYYMDAATSVARSGPRRRGRRGGEGEEGGGGKLIPVPRGSRSCTAPSRRGCSQPDFPGRNSFSHRQLRSPSSPPPHPAAASSPAARSSLRVLRVRSLERTDNVGLSFDAVYDR